MEWWRSSGLAVGAELSRRPTGATTASTAPRCPARARRRACCVPSHRLLVLRKASRLCVRVSRCVMSSPFPSRAALLLAPGHSLLMCMRSFKSRGLVSSLLVPRVRSNSRCDQFPACADVGGKKLKMLPAEKCAMMSDLKVPTSIDRVLLRSSVGRGRRWFRGKVMPGTAECDTCAHVPGSPFLTQHGNVGQQRGFGPRWQGQVQSGAQRDAAKPVAEASAILNVVASEECAGRSQLL